MAMGVGLRYLGINMRWRDPEMEAEMDGLLLTEEGREAHFWAIPPKSGIWSGIAMAFFTLHDKMDGF